MAARRGSLDELGKELDGLGVSVTRIAGDVTDADHRAALVEAAERRGSLDLLVNNASTLGPSPLPRLECFSIDALRDRSMR